MSLCGSPNCTCVIASSSSITVTGSGEATDPFVLTGAPPTDPVARAYTADNTWSKPTGLKYVIVEVQGAGGGSGGCAATGASQGAIGGGGGGGGYALRMIPASALSATETVTVGQGGTAGAAGANAGGTGGTSSFGSHCAATGGAGGGAGVATTAPNASGTNGGAGGIGSGGDVNVPGGSGQGGFALATRIRRAFGGPSVLGRSRDSDSSTTGSDGSTGLPYGGGASGAINTQSVITTRSGAVGGVGIVTVTEYYE